MAESRAFALDSVEEVRKTRNFRASVQSINQMFSPKAKLFEENQVFGFEMQSKANKYNIRNKRVTLSSNIDKNDVEEQLNRAIAEKTRGNSKKKPDFPGNSQRNRQIPKKSYYNKWFLPVKFWKIPKKQEKTRFFTGIR